MERFSALIDNFYLVFIKIRSYNIKSQDRFQTILNYICNQHQIHKHKEQPRAVYGSDIYLTKATCFYFGLNTIKVTTYVFSDLDPDTSCPKTQTCFVTLISCDLEPDITMPTYCNIVILADIYPDLLKL